MTVRPWDEPDRAWAADAIAEGVRGAGPGEIPKRLCHVAVRLLPVSGASVSLCSGGMPVPLGAGDERAALLMEIQATLGDGPCLHAARTGAPVIAADLSGRDAHRWPVFAQQATAAGVRAVYALPLGDSGGCVGTLDLYRDTPGVLSTRELHTATLMAGVMTVALSALPTDDPAGSRTVDGFWLSELATEHDEVHQAIGMIMAQLGVAADEALARLRGHAFARGLTVLDVAHEVVAHRERFERD
ncbi:GAF and ANTAR domain-containing protein [Streptomyces cadmiisoli]|uniref:GAF and ANTAR domain-containing protein n=1 Tax=Streptomyces cadmiisoli TaxID=2184053 RepID=UPI003663FB47